MHENMDFDSFDQAEFKLIKAFELYESGALTRALTELEEALELNSENSSLHFNKALVLDAMERFEEAIAEYQVALELSPEDPEILNALAVDYTRIGMYDLSIATFESIEKLNSEFEPAFCNRIITYTELGDFDLAQQMFYMAQQLNPDCPICYYNIGNALFGRNDYKRAIWCWNKTLELEPTHPHINYRIAQGYWADGNYDRAKHFFLAQLRTDAGDIEVILDFGLFLLESGDIESAREKFHRIIELNPSFAQAHLYLGEIALNSGNSDACTHFKQALDCDYQLVGPRYRLAQYALMNNQPDQAKAYLHRELELGPDDSDVLLSIGSMLLHINDIEAAINCILRVLDEDDENSQAYHYLAIASIMRGEYENAVDFFDHALAIAPKAQQILFDAAKANFAMGRTPKALDFIKALSPEASTDPEIKGVFRRIKNARRVEKFRCMVTNLKNSAFNRLTSLRYKIPPLR